MQNYQAFDIFKDKNLDDEFKDCQFAVENLIEEYQAAEKPNYAEWGNNMEMSEM